MFSGRGSEELRGEINHEPSDGGGGGFKEIRQALKGGDKSTCYFFSEINSVHTSTAIQSNFMQCLQVYFL